MGRRFGHDFCPRRSERVRIWLYYAGLRYTPGRIRTFDLCLRRAALYPLSYGRPERSV